MKTKIPVDQLETGWRSDQDVFDGNNVLIKKGVEVTDTLIRSLTKRNLEYIEVNTGSELAQRYEEASRPVDPLTKLLANSKQVYDSHQLQTAVPEEMLEKATEQLTDFFDEIEKGAPSNPNDMRPMVSMIVKELTSNAGAAVKLLDLDKFDRYTYRHSLNVGMLYAVIGQDWCDSEEDLCDEVFGAVLHDLGKAKVGWQIINKEGKLDDSEWEKMRKHPIWAAEMLAEVDASPRVISIARSHHERLDGKGYPDGLKGQEIDRFARLAAVADVYDALTTKRSYKHKMDFGRAIDIIISGCGNHFDPDIAHMFLRKVGRYPLGTFVKLSTDETAVVVGINEQAISRPVVSRTLDASGNELNKAEQLDLSREPEISIISIVVAQEVPADK